MPGTSPTPVPLRLAAAAWSWNLFFAVLLTGVFAAGAFLATRMRTLGLLHGGLVEIRACDAFSRGFIGAAILAALVASTVLDRPAAPDPG